MSAIRIGITEGRKYENYLKWFQLPSVEIVELSHRKSNASLVKRCDGIVLTGGEDIHPKFYNKQDYVEKYNLHDFNVSRDEFELEVMTRSQRLPLLGICRGLQLANVFYGGTLIPDIRSFGNSDHTKFEEGKDRYHLVSVVKDTMLAKLAGTSGEVNSAHHQSADNGGEGLAVNAFSADGIVEGMERSGDAYPYLLLVQWHPERMTDAESPFAKNVRDSFLAAVVSH
jgi:putative glutamine amidotransferase